MLDQYTNTLSMPSIPVSVTVGIDAKSAALTAFFIFLALLLALIIFGFVFKK